MIGELLLPAAFLAGFFGGTHCIGMSLSSLVVVLNALRIHKLDEGSSERRETGRLQPVRREAVS